MKRREFLKLSSFAAGAALTGCATAPGKAFSADENALVSGALIHLGSNMWTDVYTNAKPRKKSWDDKVAVDYVRAKDEVWHEVTAAMAKAKMNMIVIDLGEAVEYPSHPELKVKGTWSVAKLKRELDRLRAMGLEPIPKVNFSTTHNAWMKDWRYRVSTPEYMQTVKDIIYDVAEMFDRPRFIHIGYDEETMGHQGGWGNYQFIVVRKRELWWRDFLATVQFVRDTGARAWCFSDQAWYDPDLFEKLMPKDVVQCPWNCVKHEKYPQWLTSIDKIGEMGFDVIADCATYPGSHVKPDPSGLENIYTPIDRKDPETQTKKMMAYCSEKIPAANLKGFIVCPWVLTVPGIPREVLLDSIDYAGAEFAAFAAKRRAI